MVRWRPRPSCLPHGDRPLGVGLIEGHGVLGHVDLSTTEIYARASTEAKRKALEAAYTNIVTDNLPEWNQDPGLLSWLARL